MAKRADHEGSVYRRKNDKRWVASVSLPSGKRKEFSAMTQRAAIAKRDEYYALARQGIAALDGSQTVEQFLGSWLGRIRNSVRPSTFESYEGIARVRIVPELGHIKLRDLSVQHVQALYGKLIDGGLSRASVLKTHRVLRVALKRAVAWRLIASNPTDDADAPKPMAKEMRVLTAGEVRCLLAAASDQTMRTLYAVAATAGFRRGELLGLLWSDIDLDAGRLRVVRSLQRVTGKGMVASEPKTKAGRRIVSLTALAINELRKLLEWQRGMEESFGPDWNRDVVFASSAGTPLEETQVTRAFKGSCHRADLGKVRFHDLRHTAATVMMTAGVNPVVVQQMLGHAHVSITLAIYSHSNADLQAAATAAVDRLYEV